MTKSLWASRLASFVQLPSLVFLIALGMRFWALTQLVPGQAWTRYYQYNEFAHIAWAISTGHGYSTPWTGTPLAPTAVEPPIYSYLLAGIFRVAGPYTESSLWVALILNAVLSAVSATLILQIGKRDLGAPAGVLAAWIWSCWLYETVVAVRLWESGLTALLLLAALHLFPDLTESTRSRRWLTFGLLAGVAALTNTTTLAVFLPLWLLLWWRQQRRRTSNRKLLLVPFAICGLILIPWTIRNYRVFHTLIPVRDNFGLELWIGNHDGGTNQYPPDFPLLNPAEYNRMGELPFMQSRRDMAIRFIAHHPARFVVLSARRIFLFWTAPDYSAWPLISILAWTGLILSFRRHLAAAFPYAIVLVMFPLVYYVTHTFDTYRHPIEPEILLLASFAVVSLMRPVLKSHLSKETTGTAMVANRDVG